MPTLCRPALGFLVCTTCYTQSQDFVPDEQEAQQVAPPSPPLPPPATLDCSSSLAQ
jgi:hypothetical protein